MKTVEITFHNLGLRSGISCSLCARCPRDQVQGCCRISPSFLLTDIGFFLNSNASGFVRSLLQSSHAEILDDQVRVGAIADEERQVCRFLNPHLGCRIPMAYRNTVCRQYLCPEVGLWKDSRARRWVDFWLYLQEEEIRGQQMISDMCASRGVSLLAGRSECLRLVQSQYRDLAAACRFPDGYPEQETVTLLNQALACDIVFKQCV